MVVYAVWSLSCITRFNSLNLRSFLSGPCVNEFLLKFPQSILHICPIPRPLKLYTPIPVNKLPALPTQLHLHPCPFPRVHRDGDHSTAPQGQPGPGPGPGLVTAKAPTCRQWQAASREATRPQSHTITRVVFAPLSISNCKPLPVKEILTPENHGGIP